MTTNADLARDRTAFAELLRAQLLDDEGRRTHPYLDTMGFTTIGVGRNLTANGLHDDEIELCFANDMAQAERDARALLPNLDALSPVRRQVVCNMAFNLGRRGLGTFRNTLRAIREGRWEDAARGLLASKAARQAPNRYLRLAEQMRSDRP